jgi:metallo-beta-lactamase class B
MRWKTFAAAALALSIGVLSAGFDADAQQTWKQLPVTKGDYVKPFPPLRIVGNLYYVGTYDLGVYLITTPEGNILINTGINDSTKPIRENIEKLGFKFEDTKLLLATHGHWDHVGATAEIKRLTGAKFWMEEHDTPMVESGGALDYRFPDGRGAVYEPAKVDRKLKDGDKFTFGGIEFTVMHHPGHTLGSTSFSFTVQDGGKPYNVLLVNMASINPGVKVAGMPGFPGIKEAYTSTLAKQKQLKPQVWVASHAAQFDMHKKYKPGDAYDPNRFVDPAGYAAKIEMYEKLVQANLQKN